MRLQKTFTCQKKNLSRENLSEIEYQLLWKSCYLDLKGQTLSGIPFELIQPGTFNTGPGPDFLNAVIRIGDTVFYGAVELHLSAQDWYRHQHHTDERYNQVIAHVFPKQVLSSDFQTLNASGNSIEMIQTGLPESLPEHLQPQRIQPCGLTYISDKIYAEQAERASKGYLMQSASTFLHCSDYNSSLSIGFKKSALIRLGELYFMPYFTEKGRLLGETIGSLLENQADCSVSILKNMFEHKFSLGRGSDFTQRVTEILSLSTVFWDSTLPDSTESHTKLLARLKFQIENTIKSAQRKRVITRNWLITGLYTWASLLFDTSSMQYLFRQWQQVQGFLPDSLKKNLPSGIKKQAVPNSILKTHPNFQLDQYKSFCSKNACLTCKLSNW